MKNINLIGISGKMQSGKNTVASIIQYLIYKDKTKNPSLSLDSFLNNTFIGDSYSGFVQKSFAKKLKEIVSILTGIPVGNLEKQEVKNRVLGEEWWYYKGRNGSLIPYSENSKRNSEDLIKMTPRLLLQLLGTDCGRNIIHPNCWVNALFSDYISSNLVKDKAIRTGNNYTITSGICAGKGMLCENYQHNLDNSVYPNWIVTDLRFKNELQAIKDRGGITIRVERFCYDSAEDFLVCNPDPKLRKIGIQDYNINKTLSLEEITDIAKAHEYVPFSKQHESETALDNAKFDYVIDNNGTIEELIVKVKEILIKEQIL